LVSNKTHQQSHARKQKQFFTWRKKALTRATTENRRQSGAYVAVNGQPTAGATIASLSLTGLAVVFLKGKLSKPPQN
jgi:hypothetical protein